MKVYINIINGVIQSGYISLTDACKDLKVSYDSAARGKRIWVDGNDSKEIKQIRVEKSKRGAGGNPNFGKK